MRVLIADEGGYIGRKLAVRLAERGDEVTCLVPHLHDSPASCPHVRFLPWQVLTSSSWHAARAEAGYYIASPNGVPAESECDSVRQFAHAARDVGVRRLVGVTPWTAQETNDPCHALLTNAGVPASEVRVSAVIGHGSPAFEMIRAVVERAPVILCPPWTMAPLQPVAIADLVTFLAEATVQPGELRLLAGSSVETFSTMMAEYARARRLPRWMLPVRIPHALWLRLAEAASGLSRRQLEAIVATAGTATGRAGGHIETLPTPVDAAIRQALEVAQLPQIGARLVPEAQRTRHVIVRRHGFIVGQWQTVIAAPARDTFAVIEAMGGERGWLFADELWQLRGALDRAMGGPGLSRTRRDPAFVETGDRVDFWLVEAIERGKLLRYRAGMKMPGEAWLQFECDDYHGATLLRQTIYFQPHGLGGELYWTAMYPFHLLLFEGMHQAIAAEARRRSRAQEDRLLDARLSEFPTGQFAQPPRPQVIQDRIGELTR
ncbi:MAG: SDR family oxidoreductase [Terriglobales bacterium]